MCSISNEHVRIYQITEDNFSLAWPFMSSIVGTCSFIALDMEMSGIGDLKRTRLANLDERFGHLSKIARTRAVVSIGIACFMQDPKHKNHFRAETFDIITRCEEPYTVDPKSVKFLADNKFDFNLQLTSGIPYSNACHSSEACECPSLNGLFKLIVTGMKPLVLHNAFTDLMFLYQSFWLNLPTQLQAFVADLVDLFQGGIYDTKVLSSQLTTLDGPSYLEYLFKVCARRVRQSKSPEKLQLVFEDTMVSSNLKPSVINFGHSGHSQSTTKLCENFRDYGWCSKGSKCFLSHNIDHIIDSILGKEENSSFRTNDDSAAEGDFIQTRPQVGCHSAGYDAFMTAYIFAYFYISQGDLVNSLVDVVSAFGQRNVVFLCGKSTNLSIKKSHFANQRDAHKKKIAEWTKTSSCEQSE